MFVNNASLTFIKNTNKQITLQTCLKLENYIHEMYFGTPSLLYPHLKQEDKEKFSAEARVLFNKAKLLLRKHQPHIRFVFYYIP